MLITLSKLTASCLTIVMLSLVGQASSAAPAVELSRHAASPDQVVRQFYDWYLHAGMPNPKGRNLPIFRKYVTLKLLKEQMDPEVDADLFVAAQDFDEMWKNNISVSKATIRGQQATVQVLLKGRNGFDRRLSVTLRREKGAWKIDDVKGSE